MPRLIRHFISFFGWSSTLAFRRIITVERFPLRHQPVSCSTSFFFLSCSSLPSSLQLLFTLRDRMTAGKAPKKCQKSQLFNEGGNGEWRLEPCLTECDMSPGLVARSCWDFPFYHVSRSNDFHLRARHRFDPQQRTLHETNTGAAHRIDIEGEVVSRLITPQNARIKHLIKPATARQKCFSSLLLSEQNLWAEKTFSEEFAINYLRTRTETFRRHRHRPDNAQLSTDLQLRVKLCFCCFLASRPSEHS